MSRVFNRVYKSIPYAYGSYEEPTFFFRIFYNKKKEIMHCRILSIGDKNFQPDYGHSISVIEDAKRLKDLKKAFLYITEAQWELEKMYIKEVVDE
jgi:hypothetical protein